MNPTETKMRPILFSTEMVQAILAGRKTQTRRVVKPQFDADQCRHDLYIEADWKNEPSKFVSSASDPQFFFCEYCGNGVHVSNKFKGVKCPYGAVGDVLWVRESWRTYVDFEADNKEIIQYKADSPEDVYECDGDGFQVFNRDGSEKMLAWKSSIHMPREAGRLFLKITDIRVDRLQDISEADAVAEGIENFMDKNDKLPIYRNYLATREDLEIDAYSHCANGPEDSFESLWQKINGAESWEANPWVWVVQFERIEKPPM